MPAGTEALGEAPVIVKTAGTGAVI